MLPQENTPSSTHKRYRQTITACSINLFATRRFWTRRARRLLPALIEACAAGGYRQMIGYIDARNEASLRLHEACGFERVGVLPAVGYKFGRWSDSVMVQCPLGAGATSQPATWRRPVEEVVAGHDWGRE